MKIELSDTQKEILSKQTEKMIVNRERYAYIRPVHNKNLIGANVSTYGLVNALKTDEAKQVVEGLQVVQLEDDFDFENVKVMISNMNNMINGGIDNKYHYSHHMFKHLSFIIRGLSAGTISSERANEEMKVLNKKVIDLKTLMK